MLSRNTYALNWKAWNICREVFLGWAHSTQIPTFESSRVTTCSSTFMWVEVSILERPHKMSALGKCDSHTQKSGKMCNICSEARHQFDSTIRWTRFYDTQIIANSWTSTMVIMLFDGLCRSIGFAAHAYVLKICTLLVRCVARMTLRRNPISIQINFNERRNILNTVFCNMPSCHRCMQCTLMYVNNLVDISVSNNN